MMNTNTAAISPWRTLSAMFLVAGTCIGGGMLALPLALGTSGFLPSVMVMVACWLAMTITALLLLEVSLWMEEGVHVITMSSRLLGLPGKAASWLLFLFISYASLVAYTAEGGAQIGSTLSSLLGFPISKEWGCLLFIVGFGLVIDCGSILVGRVNAIFFVAMMAAYVLLVGIGFKEVDMSLLWHRQIHTSLLAIPLILTTFSFQTMVPSLTPYLNRNSRALRWAIIGGTTITLLIYVIWQGLIMGIIPVEGPLGLAEAFKLGEPPTKFLSEHVEGWWIGAIAIFFAFFAIVTSFLGIGLGLFDFLSDGLKISKKGRGKLLLAILIIVPTWFFATQFERIFLIAMETTGGIGDALLNGMMPVLMVWVGRYHLGYLGKFRVGGGRVLLLVTFVFYLLTFFIELGWDVSKSIVGAIF